MGGKSLKTVVYFFLNDIFTRAKKGVGREICGKEVSEKGPNPVTFEYDFFCKINTIIIFYPKKYWYICSFKRSFKEQQSY